MKVYRLIAVYFICSLSSTFAQTDRITELNILTYNIHHGMGIDDKFDLDRIAEFINLHNIDIAALQEVDSSTGRSNNIDTPNYLSEKTKMYSAFGGNINFEGGSYGNLVLSKFEIISSENIFLPNHNGGEQRGILLAKIKIENDTLIFANTHFDHREDDFERMLSAEVLIRKFSEISSNVILCGDFNDLPNSNSVSIILTHFEDAVLKTNGISDLTYPADFPSRRIDYVFYKNGESGTEILPLRSSVPKVNFSDHLPVIVGFEFRN